MESLAVRWLFPGKEVVVESRCLDCGGSIRLRTRDGEFTPGDQPLSQALHYVTEQAR